MPPLENCQNWHFFVTPLFYICEIMRDNVDQNNSEYGHFSHSEWSWEEAGISYEQNFPFFHTILWKINLGKKNKTSKIRKKQKTLIYKFWLVVPNLYLGRGEWTLDCVPTHIWDFLNISIIICEGLACKGFYTGNHAPFYLWQIKCVLKLCEVPKYQSKRLSINHDLSHAF